ncbi:P-loop containing nucleoside triphosphate hydrolase protein [Ochromonadaceae sp. CCMP2298]|nr:P-loop containing nucleoside triphosphate hydrolase protein [Ochromonadaceae sp. CCMP2298]
MKKSSVKVCVRTRPTQNFAQDNIAIDEEHNTIMIDTAQNEEPVAGMLNNKTSSFKFRFDHVFHNASQSQVYDLYARDTVQGVVDGINGAVMSYGQTGSGKTFTMMGDAQSYEHRGVAPRAISQLFNEINSRIELEFRVSCTYMEIYNEKIFDLLSDLTNPDQAQDFTIVEEKDGRGVFVRGLAEVEIKDENECLSLLFSGGLSRTIATHKLNKRSNRSHSLFTIYLQQRQRSGVSERVVHSKLHLVDLAGSERLKKTMDNMDGEAGSEVTRKESMAINRSLTYLEQCVVALSRKGQTHIPYRQSKLTNVLKDCLGANCNTVMLACMWGEASHLEETVSTLRLASRMMRVQNETVSVETVDPSALIKKQEKIIRALKQELLMHDALVERTGVTYEPYTPEQQESISQMLERFLAAPQLDEEDVLNITNYRYLTL